MRAGAFYLEETRVITSNAPHRPPGGFGHGPVAAALTSP